MHFIQKIKRVGVVRKGKGMEKETYMSKNGTQ